MRITKAKDGTPVVVGAREYRKSHRFCGRKPKKEELRRKGLLGKIPRSEMMLLTLRQRDGLKNFIEAGLDPAKKNECAVDAGYAPGPGAGGAIDNVLSKPFIRLRIAKALEKAGVSYDRIASVIAEGLNALHPTADPRLDPKTGKAYIPKDHTAIERYLRDAIDLHDLRPETRIRKEIDKRIVTIHLTGDDYAALDKYRRMRKEAALEARVEGI